MTGFVSGSPQDSQMILGYRLERWGSSFRIRVWPFRLHSHGGLSLALSTQPSQKQYRLLAQNYSGQGKSPRIGLIHKSKPMTFRLAKSAPNPRETRRGRGTVDKPKTG